jgi:hypothetical protein
MFKSVPSNPALYQRAKNIVYKQYEKPSAYRSGALVKMYKKLGGTYHSVPVKSRGRRRSSGRSSKKDDRPLKRWFEEKWTDVSPKKYMNTQHYPLYRPTRRVSTKTPTTRKEISSREISKQYTRKQTIRGEHNLPPFKKRK